MIYPLNLASVVALLLWVSVDAAQAQSSGQPLPNSQVPTLTSRSNLVLVPVLVKNKSSRPVFSLTAADFILTDDGVAQTVRMEEDALGQPLALAVIVQTGGQGASHLADYRKLGAVLEAVIGGVPHRVAVIGFDSKPRLDLDFTADTDVASETIANLQGGDSGVAILDALSFGILLLSQQPPAYRRAVLLLSETADSGSETSLEDAVRAVQNTNTAIYSFGFSTTHAAVKHEASKLPAPGGTPYSDEPYAPGGCMSRDPKADPDAHGNRGVQALDCASDLIPPLRLARMAFLAAKDGLKRNVPRSVAQLTGGEYFPFKDAKTLAQHLITISNDVPNYYYLSFRPQSPHPGLHALELRVKTKPEYEVMTRKGYWVDAAQGPKEKE
jgi:VWFA-related protein